MKQKWIAVAAFFSFFMTFSSLVSAQAEQFTGTTSTPQPDRENEMRVVHPQPAAPSILGTVNFFRDSFGRISRIGNTVGDYVDFTYGEDGLASPSSSVFKGKLFNSATTKLLLPTLLARSSHKRIIDSEVASGNLPQSASQKYPGEQAQLKSGSDCNLTVQGCDPNVDWQAIQCAANPACFGIWDDLSSFVGALSNWIQVGGAIGGGVFGVLSVLAADSAAIILVEAGLGALLGSTVVLAGAGVYLVFSAGYYVGTWGYNSYNQLVYSGK